MEINGVKIEDTFAEAFPMVACRAIITAETPRWAEIAARAATGYATSVIACDAEAGIERFLAPHETPDNRPGASVLFFGFNRDKLEKAVANRIGQCVMTSATSSCYDGLSKSEKYIKIGGNLRYFGDGFQASKLLDWRFDVSGSPSANEIAASRAVAGGGQVQTQDQCEAVRKRRIWRVPVMDGEFVCEDLFGTVKGVAGGNFLIFAKTQVAALAAAESAIQAISNVPHVIAPFPGGIVRSGSKVGSKYKKLRASTNDAYCPTLRPIAKTALPDGVNAVYEIVLDGLSLSAVEQATRVGVSAACVEGVVQISAGNYGGNLGPHHIRLHDVLKVKPESVQ